MNGAFITRPSFDVTPPRTNYMAGNHRWQLSQNDPRLQTKGSKETNATMIEIERHADPRLTTFTELGQKHSLGTAKPKPKKRKAKKRHRKK